MERSAYPLYFSIKRKDLKKSTINKLNLDQEQENEFFNEKNALDKYYKEIREDISQEYIINEELNFKDYNINNIKKTNASKMMRIKNYNYKIGYLFKSYCKQQKRNKNINEKELKNGFPIVDENKEKNLTPNLSQNEIIERSDINIGFQENNKIHTNNELNLYKENYDNYNSKNNLIFKENFNKLNKLSNFEESQNNIEKKGKTKFIYLKKIILSF